MVKLVGLLILVLAVAIVLSDVSKEREQARKAQREERAASEDPVRALPISRGQNDPYMTHMQSQLETLTTLVGAALGGGAGAGVGRFAGSAVSAAEVESARGLASHPTSTRETSVIGDASRSAGQVTGEAWGANVAGGVGGFLGQLPALPVIAGQSVVNGITGALGGLHATLRDRGVYAAADAAGVPKW